LSKGVKSFLKVVDLLELGELVRFRILPWHKSFLRLLGFLAFAGEVSGFPTVETDRLIRSGNAKVKGFYVVIRIFGG
jgi:hypothetical protein